MSKEELKQDFEEQVKPLEEDVAEKVEQVEEVEEDLDSLKDKLLRSQADFENYRKRMTKERMDSYKYGSEPLIVEILDVLDNFDRAIDSAERATDMKTMMQGILMVQKQLHDVLQGRGVQKMVVKGELFNPGLHEAVAHEEDSMAKEGEVLEEMQSGYKLHEKVIRFAKVKVAQEKK